MKILEKIKEWIENKKFESKHGFKKIEALDFRIECAKWILPRLKYLKENTCGSPIELTQREWGNVLKKMIEGIELTTKNNIYKGKELKKAEKSMELFSKWYFNLWY